jgi:Spy/CpxP family protein refolding chaperone
MKIKLMPMLAAVMAISAVATPLTLKAQPIHGQPLLAQAQQHPGKRAQLNLTDAQKSQLRQIEIDIQNQMQSVLTAEQREKLKTLRQQNSQGNRQARRDVMSQLNLSEAQQAKIQELRKAQQARMDAVFTPEQKQQLQQMHQQWQQQGN